MNLLTTELFKQYGSGTGTGEIELRNNVNAMRVLPAPYWGGSGEYGNPNFKGVLRGCFLPNTLYIFDIWADADSSYYDALSINVPGGFYIVYTDNTSDLLTVTGSKTNPMGYQHKRIISLKNKTIDALNPYYYTNTPIYYRYDSVITEIGNVDINKNGILLCKDIIEDFTNYKTSIISGGIIRTKEINEI